MNHEQKLYVMGVVAAELLQLHLKDPKKYDPQGIVERLFDKFEELELEEEVEDNAGS